MKITSSKGKEPEKKSLDDTEPEEKTADVEIDPVDDLLPRWIEFAYLGNEKEIADAVKQFFTDDRATADDFKQQFGVDLTKFIGYFLETGVADAPQGPLTPRRVTPILVLQQSRSGKSFSTHMLKHDGLMHDSRRVAWIEREAWDAHVQDTFAEEIREKAAKLREAQKRAAAKMAAEQADGEKEE